MNSIINEFQKVVFNTLNNIDNLNIYSCPRKNSNFPYLVMSVSNVTLENNFHCDNYFINLSISLYDKNESNLNIINLSKKVKDLLISLSNNKQEIFIIVDVNLNNMTNILFNDVNSVWNTTINFNITLSEY